VKRREFFKLGVQKAAEAALEVAGQKQPSDTINHIRPPYALVEPKFLDACTRCDDCLEACPHNVIFRLGGDRGLLAAGTPALDLLRVGCRMCEDWPCIAACETGALSFPETNEGEDPPSVVLAEVAINVETCLPYAGPECGACAGSCPVPGALNWENGLRPWIEQSVCTGCALCREVCITDPKSIDIAVLSPQRLSPQSPA